MMKLIVDPTEAAGHEVDFRDAADSVLLVPTPGGRSRDRTYERYDGGEVVEFRRWAHNFTLAVDIDHDQYEDLLRIRAERKPLMLFPNMDRHTLISANLCGSLEAWIRNRTTRLMEKTAGTLTRASTMWRQREDELLESKGSGIPVFAQSALGNGLECNAPLTNKLGFDHPASGSLGWTGSSTAGPAASLAWNSDILSPKADEAGCLEITRAINTGNPSAYVNVLTGDTGTGNWYYAVVWLLGGGRYRLMLNEHNGSAYVAGGDTGWVDSPSEGGWWPLVLAHQKSEADERQQVELRHEQSTSAARFYVGPSNLLQRSWAGSYAEPDPFWRESGHTAGDVLKFNSPMQGEDFTLSIACVLPRSDQQCCLWQLEDAANSARIRFIPTVGLRITLGGVVPLDVSIPGWSANWAGRPCMVHLRYKPRAAATGDGDRGVYARVSIMNADGDVEMVDGITNDPAVADFAGEVHRVGSAVSDQFFCAEARPQFFRIDERAWSDDEIRLHSRLFLEDAFRSVIAATTGRTYRIASKPLAHRVGNWGQMVGSVQLSEMGIDPDTVVVD